MKKLLFLAVSALIAGVSFCSAVGNKVIANVSNNEKSNQQDNQLLVLEKAADTQSLLAWHYSHGSHGSHISHGSHTSHTSHLSGR